MEKFTLRLYNNTPVVMLPNVPIKKMEIHQNGRYFNKQLVLKIANMYCKTIEDLKLIDFQMGFYQMFEILMKMKNLRNLVLSRVNLTSIRSSQVKLPKLKSLAIDWNGNAENILSMFMYNNSIDTVDLSSIPRQANGQAFEAFIETVPNVKHLKMSGIGGERFHFLHSNMSLTLETLDANHLDFPGNVQFIQRQMGSLKELRIRHFPQDHNAAEVTKTIYELNLEKLYWAAVPFILNYEVQHVENQLKFSLQEFGTALEILKRGRSFKEICLKSASGFDGELRPYLANYEQTMDNRALNLNEFEISIIDLDDLLIDRLIGFFWSCRNIKRFRFHGIIYAQTPFDFYQNLQKFLPFFEQLEELDIICNFEENEIRINPHELLNLITVSCPTLRKLRVRSNLFGVAKEYFRHSNLIIESNRNSNIDWD
jgi:hypothetical protein